MPVPAGMRCPMMMFSFKPKRSSRAPRIAASVSTRVVSWNDAAEMNDCVVRLALVIPRSSGSLVGGLPPFFTTRSFASEKVCLSTFSPSRNSVSPGSTIFTFCSIWRTITPMCLSLIFTPCNRYTSWTSLSKYSCPARGPGVLAQRGPGGVPVAGREDQRQAHRRDRAPDAAEGEDRRARGHGVPGGGERGQADLLRREGSGREEGRQAPDQRAAAPGDHQGESHDAVVHFGGVVPGDDPGADRRGDPRGPRRPLGLEGEHHHRASHPGGNGDLPLPRDRDRAAGGVPAAAAAPRAGARSGAESVPGGSGSGLTVGLSDSFV